MCGVRGAGANVFLLVWFPKPQLFTTLYNSYFATLVFHCSKKFLQACKYSMTLYANLCGLENGVNYERNN